MTRITTVHFLAAALLITLVFIIRPLHALGTTGSSVPAVYSTTTVCGIVADSPIRGIVCFKDNRSFPVYPNISYDSIVAGRSFFCGLTEEGTVILCWDTGKFEAKRIYYNESGALSGISIGDDQVCGVVNGTGRVLCWRGIKGGDLSRASVGAIGSISCGLGFCCGVLTGNGSVRCWGSDEKTVGSIQGSFEGLRMSMHSSCIGSWRYDCPKG